jgi:hypothetical protein
MLGLRKPRLSLTACIRKTAYGREIDVHNLALDVCTWPFCDMALVADNGRFRLGSRHKCTCPGGIVLSQKLIISDYTPSKCQNQNLG